MIFPFPELRQVTCWDCVASALSAHLAACGIDVREEKILKIARTTPRDGTNTAGILRVHRYYKIPCRAGSMTPDDLCRAVDRHHPTLLLLQAYRDDPAIPWQDCWDDGHGVTCIGYRGKKPRRRFIFEDPSSYVRTWLSERELLLRWHDLDPGNVRLLQWGCETLVRSRYRPGRQIRMG